MFILAASPFFILNYQTTSNPIGSIFGIQESIEQSIPPSSDASQLDLKLQDKFFIAVTEEIKHIFRIIIPFLALFIPFGIISFISKMQFKEKIMILTIVFCLIVGFGLTCISIVCEYQSIKTRD